MIGDIIRKQREFHNMTQKDLAKKLGVSRVAENNWEIGVSEPSLRHIIKIAALFNISTDFLLETGTNESINCDGLTDMDKTFLANTAEFMRKKNKTIKES